MFRFVVLLWRYFSWRRDLMSRFRCYGSEFGVGIGIFKDIDGV